MAFFDERAFTQLFFPVPRKWREHSQAPCYVITKGDVIVDTYSMDEDLARWVGQPASAARNTLGERLVAIPVERLHDLEKLLAKDGVSDSRVSLWEQARDRLGRKALGIRPEHFLIRSRAIKSLSKRRPLSIAFRFKEFPDQATWILFRDGQVAGCQDIGLVSKQDREWGKIVHEAVALPTWTVELSWELWNQLITYPRPWKAITKAWRKGELVIDSTLNAASLKSAKNVGTRVRTWLFWSDVTSRLTS
jgi:hypothetical protein